jgi:hypothetical protein
MSILLKNSKSIINSTVTYLIRRIGKNCVFLVSHFIFNVFVLGIIQDHETQRLVCWCDGLVFPFFDVVTVGITLLNILVCVC